MTDYEKLIKEARTLEGMYYDGRKDCTIKSVCI